MDPSVTLYNMCKKIAQLYKVVQYISAHLEERAFQSDALQKQYFAEIDKVIALHEKNATKFLSELDPTARYESIQNNLARKHDILQTALKQTEIDARKAAEDEEKAFATAIKPIKLTLNQINDELKVQIEFLSKKVVSDNTEMVTTINNMVKKHKREVLNCDNESEAKYQELKQINTDKIKALQEEHKAHMQQVVEEHKALANTPVDIKALRNGKLKLQNTREFLLQTNTKTQDMIKQYLEIMSNIQPKVVQFSKQIAEYSKEYEEDVKLNDQHYDMVDAEYGEELDKVKDQRDAVKKSQNMQIQLLKNELTSLQNSFKVELEKAEKNVNDVDTNIENLVKMLRGQHFKEEEERRKMINAEREAKERYMNIAMRDHQLAMDDLKANIVKSNDEVDDEKLILQKAMDAENERFENQRRYLIQQHEEVIMQKHRELEASSALESSYKKADQDRKSQKTMLDTINRIFKTSMENIIVSERDEIRQLELNYEKMRNEIQTSCDNEYNAKNGFISVSFNDLTAQFEEELSIKSQESQKNIENEIEKLQNEFSELKSIEEIRNSYEEEYNKLLNELENFSEEPVANEKYSEKHLNDINEMKSMTIDKTNKEKQKLLDKYQTDANNEQHRHETKLLSYITHMNDHLDIDTELQKIRERETVKITKYAQQITEFSEKLKELQLEFKPATGDAAVDCPEIQDLRNQLSLAMKNQKETLDKARNDCDSQIKALKDEIKKTEETNEESYKNLENSLEFIITQIKDTIQSDQDKKKKRKIEIEEMIVFLGNKYEQDKTNSQDAFEQHRTDLLNELDVQDKNLNNQIVDDSEIEQNNAMEFKKKLKEEQEKMKLDILKYKDELNNINPELDAAVDDAYRKRDAAKHAFDTKPIRDQEKGILLNLSEILYQKTSYLYTIGRDLLEYRARIVAQEEEVNSRFGRDSQIGVMRSQPARPMTAVVKKRTMRLTTPV